MQYDWSGRWTSCAKALATAALSAALFLGAGNVSAQQGAVTGTVTDAETLQPVAGAQVFVSGTVIGTLSGAQGTYRLEGVPVGQTTVTIRLIGYRELSQSVTVQAGQVATADFVVEQTALRLQDDAPSEAPVHGGAFERSGHSGTCGGRIVVAGR